MASNAALWLRSAASQCWKPFSTVEVRSGARSIAIHTAASPIASGEGFSSTVENLRAHGRHGMRDVFFDRALAQTKVRCDLCVRQSVDSMHEEYLASSRPSPIECAAQTLQTLLRLQNLIWSRIGIGDGEFLHGLAHVKVAMIFRMHVLDGRKAGRIAT